MGARLTRIQSTRRKIKDNISKYYSRFRKKKKIIIQGNENARKKKNLTLESIVGDVANAVFVKVQHLEVKQGVEGVCRDVVEVVLAQVETHQFPGKWGKRNICIFIYPFVSSFIRYM